MAKKNTYDNETIVALEGEDRVRKRPAVIFGSDGLEGCEHSVFEIVSNSIDEAREGYGDKIIITYFNDKSIEVEDFGRGCPMDYNKSAGRYNWELVYCELYAGGKYNNNGGENYQFSLGLNGLGACATQYASEYMDVTVNRDGFRYEMHFEKGRPVGKLEKTETGSKKTGTKHRWKPDLDVFTETAIPAEYFEQMLKRQAVVNPHVKFILRLQNPSGGFDEQVFLYENGISDYVTEIAGDSALTSVYFCDAQRTGRDRADMEDYKVKLNVAFTFSNQVKMCEYYHNSSFLEHGGAPADAVKNAFRYQIDNYLKQNNKYLKNETPIKFVDVEDCLVLVSSSFSTMTSYANQTKKAVTNKFIQECMTDFLKHQLEVYFIENPDEATKIAEQVIINKRSRERADTARLNLKNTLSKQIDMTNMVKKFVDCRSKDVAQRELYIVEGDSALGSVKMARNAEFQAVMPVRGKILNCLKTDYDDIFKSPIITDLIKVLGCGVEVKTRANKDISMFSLDNLRWNKIVICTDADVDGFHIRTLILTMLYRLTPTLIEKGYVYIAESPLYEITTKAQTYFAYDDREKSEILQMIGDEKYTIQRSKGLGENEADMMALTTMNPSTRRLIQVTPDESEFTQYMFDVLMGDNLQARKDFFAINSKDYLDMADIS